MISPFRHATIPASQGKEPVWAKNKQQVGHKAAGCFQSIQGYNTALLYLYEVCAKYPSLEGLEKRRISVFDTTDRANHHRS
jgi:hypothetical protein